MEIHNKSIRVAIAGLGNCASSLIEGLAFYYEHPKTQIGLLFPQLAGYAVQDIQVVAAFDISAQKVGKPICEAIYASPNNFVRNPNVHVKNQAHVFRAPTLDGNPEHLARLVPESSEPPVDVASVLKNVQADVLVNLLPTGSIQATEFYGESALRAGCAFINCIPTVYAQRTKVQNVFRAQRLPLLGDDIKSQIGTTILHRALLHLLEARGATLHQTSQINIGGNTDFVNFIYRAETKLVSKRKSLRRYLNNGNEFHVGHHFDPTKGPYKHALIEIDSVVFANSPVKISVKLESDDKPNSAGSIVDLIRIAQGARDRGMGGLVPEACAYYFKSQPVEMDDPIALALVRDNWANETAVAIRDAQEQS